MTESVGQVANLPGQISNLPHDIDFLTLNSRRVHAVPRDRVKARRRLVIETADWDKSD